MTDTPKCRQSLDDKACPSRCGQSQQYRDGMPILKAYRFGERHWIAVCTCGFLHLFDPERHYLSQLNRKLQCPRWSVKPRGYFVERTETIYPRQLLSEHPASFNWRGPLPPCAEYLVEQQQHKEVEQ